jgi:hypothetical protein
MLQNIKKTEINDFITRLIKAKDQIRGAFALTEE